MISFSFAGSGGYLWSECNRPSLLFHDSEGVAAVSPLPAAGVTEDDRVCETGPGDDYLSRGARKTAA